MRDRFLKRLFIVGGLIILGAIPFMRGLAHIGPYAPDAGVGIEHTVDQVTAPMLTQKRMTHIVYGDNTGGGHLHGLGKPCKSEFPEGWTEQDIADTVLKIAANDNLAWREQKNGLYVAEAVEKGITIRVVVDRKRNAIITGYPVSTPRNACPAANDNSKP